jgi:hypothetical protein
VVPILIAVLVAGREVDKRRAAANDERSGNESAERPGADERSGDDGQDERPGDDAFPGSRSSYRWAAAPADRVRRW